MNRIDITHIPGAVGNRDFIPGYQEHRARIKVESIDRLGDDEWQVLLIFIFKHYKDQYRLSQMYTHRRYKTFREAIKERDEVKRSEFFDIWLLYCALGMYDTDEENLAKPLDWVIPGAYLFNDKKLIISVDQNGKICYYEKIKDGAGSNPNQK